MANANEWALKEASAVESNAWLNDVESFWEKETRLIPNVGSRIQCIDPEHIFDAVTNCVGEHLRNRNQRIRLYVDAVEIDYLASGCAHLLPASTDGSFEAYNERMLKFEGMKDYALVVADWHQFSWEAWYTLLDSIVSLSRQVGTTRSRIDTQIFLGSYRVTPFGVHTDPVSAFHFPILGSKTMRFWPWDYGTEHEDLHRAVTYDSHLAASSSITAKPGEVIYWPSTHWHVAESSGEFSATWGLGYWTGSNLKWRAANQAVESAFANSGSREVTSKHQPSNAEENAAEILSDISDYLSSDSFECSLAESVLAHFSSHGLRPPRGRNVCAKGSKTLRSCCPLLSRRIGDSVVVAANGRSRCFPWSVGLIEAISGYGAERSRPPENSTEISVELDAFLIEVGALTD